jgi:hypothetical protein
MVVRRLARHLARPFEDHPLLDGIGPDLPIPLERQLPHRGLRREGGEGAQQVPGGVGPAGLDEELARQRPAGRSDDDAAGVDADQLLRVGPPAQLDTRSRRRGGRRRRGEERAALPRASAAGGEAQQNERDEDERSPAQSTVPRRIRLATVK